MAPSQLANSMIRDYCGISWLCTSGTISTRQGTIFIWWFYKKDEFLIAGSSGEIDLPRNWVIT